MKLSANATGTYLVIGYVNFNNEGLKSLQLFKVNTEIGSVALSDVGQYHWRGGTIVQVVSVNSGEEISLRIDGNYASAAAAGRAGLVLVRIDGIRLQPS